MGIVMGKNQIKTIDLFKNRALMIFLNRLGLPAFEN